LTREGVVPIRANDSRVAIAQILAENTTLRR
jgi:hypothetical protein